MVALGARIFGWVLQRVSSRVKRRKADPKLLLVLEEQTKKKRGALRLCLAAPVIAGDCNLFKLFLRTRFGRLAVSELGVTVRRPLAALLLVLRGREERRQGVGGGVFRMPDIGQAKGGFNRLQQRIVRLKARVLDATHPVVRDGNEHHFVVEVGGSVAVGSR